MNGMGNSQKWYPDHISISKHCANITILAQCLGEGGTGWGEQFFNIYNVNIMDWKNNNRIKRCHKKPQRKIRMIQELLWWSKSFLQVTNMVSSIHIADMLLLKFLSLMDCMQNWWRDASLAPSNSAQKWGHPQRPEWTRKEESFLQFQTPKIIWKIVLHNYWTPCSKYNEWKNMLFTFDLSFSHALMM